MVDQTPPCTCTFVSNTFIVLTRAQFIRQKIGRALVRTESLSQEAQYHSGWCCSICHWLEFVSRQRSDRSGISRRLARWRLVRANTPTLEPRWRNSTQRESQALCPAATAWPSFVRRLHTESFIRATARRATRKLTSGGTIERRGVERGREACLVPLCPRSCDLCTSDRDK